MYGASSTFEKISRIAWFEISMVSRGIAGLVYRLFAV